MILTTNAKCSCCWRIRNLISTHFTENLCLDCYALLLNEVEDAIDILKQR